MLYARASLATATAAQRVGGSVLLLLLVAQDLGLAQLYRGKGEGGKLSYIRFRGEESKLRYPFQL